MSKVVRQLISYQKEHQTLLRGTLIDDEASCFFNISPVSGIFPGSRPRRALFPRPSMSNISTLSAFINHNNFPDYWQSFGLGICESTSWCNSHHGAIYSGACPDAPEDIKCCEVPECQGTFSYCIEDTLYCNGHFVT